MKTANVISIEQVRNVNAVVVLGQLTPKWNGALQLDFRWKGLNVFAKVVYYTGHALRDDVVTLYDPYNAIEEERFTKIFHAAGLRNIRIPIFRPWDCIPM